MKKKPVVSPRSEYLMEKRQRIVASPLLSTKFPALKSVSAELRYLDADHPTRKSEIKYVFNMEYARSAFLVNCENPNCVHGGFDLSEVLADGIEERQTTIEDNLTCHGSVDESVFESTPCGKSLRYKLSLSY